MANLPIRLNGSAEGRRRNRRRTDPAICRQPSHAVLCVFAREICSTKHGRFVPCRSLSPLYLCGEPRPSGPRGSLMSSRVTPLLPAPPFAPLRVFAVNPPSRQPWVLARRKRHRPLNPHSLRLRDSALKPHPRTHPPRAALDANLPADSPLRLGTLASLR